MMNTPNYVYCNYRLNHGKWNKFFIKWAHFPIYAKSYPSIQSRRCSYGCRSIRDGRNKSHLQSEKNEDKFSHFNKN